MKQAVALLIGGIVLWSCPPGYLGAEPPADSAICAKNLSRLISSCVAYCFGSSSIFAVPRVDCKGLPGNWQSSPALETNGKIIYPSDSAERRFNQLLNESTAPLAPLESEVGDLRVRANPEAFTSHDFAVTWTNVMGFESPSASASTVVGYDLRSQHYGDLSRTGLWGTSIVPELRSRRDYFRWLDPVDVEDAENRSYYLAVVSHLRKIQP